MVSHWDTLKKLIKTFIVHRLLVVELVKREVFGRYRGQMGGITWSFVNPLIMLGVYTFFFSMVYQAKWGGITGGSHVDFALILFAGLIVFNFFSECISRAPMLITSNANYVKKILFPLEILPGISLGTALVHACISFFILIVVQIFTVGNLPWTIIFLPLILLPFMMMVIGFSWFLAATGVYVRDINQVTGFLLPITMFLSPIFCPITAFPKQFHTIIYLNPLSCIIEEVRNVLILGIMPNFINLGVYLLFSIVIAFLGFAWFQATRSGFADVL